MYATRCLAPALIVAVCIGCIKPGAKTEEKSKTNEPGGRKVALENQFGLAGDLDDLAKRRAAANPKGQPIAQPKVHERRVAGSAGNFGVMTNQVYNLPEIVKLRPDLKVMSKSTTGSFVTTSYYAPASRASALAFKHNMDIWKATNDRYPTYREYISQTKQFKLEMAKLPPWQVWAYNERTGELKVLEDPKKKAEIEGK
jgi:hypothetical protein